MKFGWMIWMALVALGAGNELRAQVVIEDGEIVLETPVGLDEEMAENEPIDLRKSTASEIARLPGITMQDALSIVELLERNRRAGFETIAEIDGMTAEKLLVLRTNCMLGVLPPLQRQPARVSQRLRVRSELQRRRGYDQPLYRIVGGASDIDTITVASRYIGSPLAIVSAIDYDDGSITAHLLAAKDPGEPYVLSDTASYSYQQLERDSTGSTGRSESRRVVPFIGGGLLWRSGSIAIAVGDYFAGAASGIALAARAEQRVPIIPRSTTTMLRLARSSDEASYLRGVAAIYCVDQVELLAFHSIRFRDARIDSIDRDGERFEGVISLHDGVARRTYTDLRRQSNLREIISGGRVVWNGADLHCGATAYRTSYSRPILPAGSDLWSGRKATVFALDAGASLGRIDLSMEASRSPAGVIGITAGASTRFERAALQIGLSEIPSGYNVPHGNGMSPFDRPGGRRLGVSIQASPLPALEVDLSLSSTSAIENEGLGEPKTLAEIALRYEAGSGLSLRSVLRLAGSTETGTMQRDGRERFLSIDRSDVAAGLEADLALDRHGSRLRAGIIFRQQNTITSAMSRFTFAELTQTIAETLTVAGRFALFDGEAPVYQFEQLLAGWPRTVALSGRGARFWIRGSGEIWGPMRIGAFIARTIYFDRMTISEGTADEIAGDSAAMAGFQIDLRFDL